jgi:hypothetical protein
MNTNRLAMLAFGLALLGLVLAACGGPRQGSFPTGKFIKSGTTDYGFNFNPDGTFSVFDAETILVNGTYKVEGNVFTETSNDGNCRTNVSFTYAFDGKNLTFNYVGDPNEDAACGFGGRRADFDNVTYILSE